MKNRKMIMAIALLSIVILVFSACTPKQNNTATATPEVNKQAAQQQEEKGVKKLNENIDTTNEFRGNAYNFELNDIEGNMHKLSDYVGKKVYIKFWATWCSVCISGMPDFLEFVEQNKDNQDLVILTIVSPGVSGEMDTERFKDWYQKQGMNFNVLLDENGSVMREYGIKGFPTSVFVDTSGNIAKENIGHIDNNEIDQTLSEMQ